MGGLARDVHGLGCGSYRPATLDPSAETKATLGGQRSITVHDEPPWLCGCEQLHTALGAHFIESDLSTRSMG
jgi:hypothetical protein